MRVHLYCLILYCFFLSCDNKNKTEGIISKIPLEIEVERFDKVFFETDPKDLDKIKKEFPFFFPVENEDGVWLNRMQDPLWRELYTEVEKKYANFEPVQIQLKKLFKHIKYYFPKTKAPKVITVISQMDYNNKAIYADSLVIISLEMYLGKDHKFYQFPNYIKQNFEENQIMPDLVSSFYKTKAVPILTQNLLSKMINSGKELYFKDILLPNYSDADKMGYTKEQVAWCNENESYMWRYFIERELLYSVDQKLMSRFINPAPFSKFYLEIDNETPGQVGGWVGWQIVRSYMKNNEVSLQQLANKDAKEIFEKSKYKPKK
jgi:gliding motility-associated lipoprotein GldB